MCCSNRSCDRSIKFLITKKPRPVGIRNSDFVKGQKDISYNQLDEFP